MTGYQAIIFDQHLCSLVAAEGYRLNEVEFLFSTEKVLPLGMRHSASMSWASGNRYLLNLSYFILLFVNLHTIL